jgi:hypothetical protein
MQSFAYSEGLVDPADVQFGPGMLIPVVGSPQEFLFPIPTGNISNAGFQEMAEMKGDFDRSSGISDVVTGGGPLGWCVLDSHGRAARPAGRDTALELKARRLEVEIVTPQCRQFIQMNQREYALARGSGRSRRSRPPTSPTSGTSGCRSGSLSWRGSSLWPLMAGRRRTTTFRRSAPTARRCRRSVVTPLWISAR